MTEVHGWQDAIPGVRAGAGAFTFLFELYDREPWMLEGLCAQVGHEAFFPEKGQSTRAAKQICKGCDVRQQCLDYALRQNERFGIFGGMSYPERKKLGQSTQADMGEAA